MTEIRTARLRLRRPRADDAQAIFEGYSGDPEVTRYLSWPLHTRVNETLAFIEASDREWSRWPCGPLIIESMDSGALLGGSGLNFETPFRASTGYVLARPAWGRGIATEALGAVMELAKATSLWRVDAQCHHDHVRSARVLLKCGFHQEGTLRRHTVFPNIDDRSPQDVMMFACILRHPRS